MANFLKKIFMNTDKENIELIRKSKYFDEKYYLSENPKLKGDPCRHYYYYGWKEGKSPSFEFSNNFYLKNYKDVKDAGMNPLLHYLKYGKAENRVIEKDDGLTLKKIYEKIYNCAYFYKTYIHDTNEKRVNLFFDSIDKDVENLSELFNYIVKFCESEKRSLRIIYFHANFEILKKVLEKNKIKLPNKTIFLNLKSSNYLEVGLNEKYICTSWKTARALLNTASIHSNIYYYLPENIETLPKEEFYQISNICTNDHVIVMTNNKNTLDAIKKCQLKIEIGDKKLSIKNANQLYCDFDKMFIVGVELLNAIFLTNKLSSSAWRVNILDNEHNFKFHFDTNVSIRKVNKIEADADFIFCMSYYKKNVSYNNPYLNAWIEEQDIKIKKFILITEPNFQKLLQEENFSISNIDNDYQNFKKYISKLKDEEVDNNVCTKM